MVNSQSKCTTLSGRKDFMWCLKVEALPRSMIQFFDDLCKRFIRYVGEAGAFREVLSQSPVRVLVGAALPRRVGISKVDS